MDFGSADNSLWLFDYGLMEDIPVKAGAEFPGSAESSFSWPLELVNSSPNARWVLFLQTLFCFFFFWFPLAYYFY